MADAHGPGRQHADIDHYAVLGVERSATKVQIRARFLRLVKVHHPDKSALAPSSAAQAIPPATAASVENASDGDTSSGASTPSYVGVTNSEDSQSRALSFHQIYEAYNTLSDDDARALYDLERRRAAAKGRDDHPHGQAAPPPRVAATLDLENFEAVQTGEEEDAGISFCHPCRCGNEYVLSSGEVLRAEEQAQQAYSHQGDGDTDSRSSSSINGYSNDQVSTLLQCSGCSEVIQVVWSRNAEDEDADSGDDGEP